MMQNVQSKHPMKRSCKCLKGVLDGALPAWPFSDDAGASTGTAQEEMMQEPQRGVLMDCHLPGRSQRMQERQQRDSASWGPVGWERPSMPASDALSGPKDSPAACCCSCSLCDACAAVTAFSAHRGNSSPSGFQFVVLQSCQAS